MSAAVERERADEERAELLHLFHLFERTVVDRGGVFDSFEEASVLVEGIGADGVSSISSSSA